MSRQTFFRSTKQMMRRIRRENKTLGFLIQRPIRLTLQEKKEIQPCPDLAQLQEGIDRTHPRYHLNLFESQKRHFCCKEICPYEKPLTSHPSSILQLPTSSFFKGFFLSFFLSLVQYSNACIFRNS